MKPNCMSIRLLSFLLCLSCLLGPAPTALGLEPAAVTGKGTAAASGPWLDETFYADGSAYPTPEKTVETVRIGLKYGKKAEGSYQLRSGEGFLLGYYDGERKFNAVEFLDYAGLEIVLDGSSLALYDTMNWACVFAGDPGRKLALHPQGETIYLGDDCYAGGFEFFLNEEGRITVVNVVGLEDYVKGVVPYEMGSAWPIEALKAQAVCARTYVVYNQDEYIEQGFDIAAGEESQVYRGRNWASYNSDLAVEETKGQLIFSRGELCQIYYSAADGGASEDGVSVFDAPHSYLNGKLDPFESAVDYPMKSWELSLTPYEVGNRLRSWNYQIRNVVSIQPNYSRSGNVVSILFSDDDGTELLVSGRRCYNALRLYTCHFTVEFKDGKYHFSGSGLGHNCGMSQWGARAMAESYGYDYQQILRFYYTGAYIA